MFGVGSLAVPLLIKAFGTNGALIVAGALLPLASALAWPRLRRIDPATAEVATRLALLRQHEIFAPLAPPTLESLAAHLVEVDVKDGHAVIREGDPGDRFYLVREGSLEATVDGRRLSILGPGEGFGEIALLRGVPRTATVSARGPARLYALDRDVFLSAVTAHPVSASAGEAVAGARLAQTRSAGPVALT
jgi:CRP-like cAMP-binding protein